MIALRASLVPLLLLLSTAASAQPVCTTTDPAIQERIERVVQGLLPLSGPVPA